MNVRTVIRILRRRWVSLLVFPLLFLGLGVGLTLLTPRVYESSTETFITASGGSTNSDMVSGTTYAQNQVTSYMELVTSQLVLSPVIARLELDTTPSELAQRISVDVAERTTVMEVTAAAPSPEEATRLAREVTTQFVDTVERMETPPGSDASKISATVIRDALVPGSPSSPVLWRNVALALFVGLALGALFAFLRERADPVIRTADEAAEMTSLPVLGRVPFEPRRSRQAGRQQAGTPRAEAFNTLRTNLGFVRTAGESAAFVITSARPGEGKSSTVADLATSLDVAGERVLIIEADLRRPKLGEYLGLISSVGLTDVLVGTATLEEVAQPYGENDVWFLGAGPIPPNPVELLSSPAMHRLLDAVRETFDIVLIDAPPLLPVTDAAILSQQAGNAILVIGIGVAERGDMDRSLDSLDRVDAKLAGVVLNRVPSVEAPNAYSYAARPATQDVHHPRPSEAHNQTSLGSAGATTERGAPVSRTGRSSQ